jgi:RimJ/RimL family protein N-acetyltransferase
MTIEAPVIVTERLTLRGHARADFADSRALWADPIVTRYIGGRPFTDEEVWTRLLRYVGHWAVMGFGYWVARDTATGRLVGEVGFADYRREIDPPFDGAPEMGWVIAPWAHGRGFASEAVRAALAWGDKQLGVARTVCMIDPGNDASLRVAARHGFVEYARTPYKGQDAILFERRR